MRQHTRVMVTLRFISFASPSFEADIAELSMLLRAGGLTAGGSSDAPDVPRIVGNIIAEVRHGGDRAVAELTSRLDRATVDAASLRIRPEELTRSHRSLDPKLLEVLRQAAENIRSYQQHILVQAPAPLRVGGRLLGIRYTPIERVGVYVPGGRALYPSTVLMSVVPAQVAGVREIVMVSPPTGGRIHPLALALAHELGVREVYQVGGAVAVAALALGTETIRPVHKIVGPGNAFVAEAKRQLFGTVGIDCIAGPSEVFVIADDHANPAWVAADLLAQAEHNPGSAVLATPSLELGRKVLTALDTQLAELERTEATRMALEHYSGIIITRDLAHACELANLFASEHLEIITGNDEGCVAQIRHAGAIFLGAHTPVPVGDYFAGPSHVLPTGGTARFSSPLSANEFRKSSSLIAYDAESLAEDGPKIVDFARHEGLTAHAAAVKVRIDE
ncbi:MAG: histidinol dehydrogenase [Polyangiaceae bacterium]|nr:histidinol dehydrogenase [Polyangiaceae bacterium]